MASRRRASYALRMVAAVARDAYRTPDARRTASHAALVAAMESSAALDERAIRALQRRPAMSVLRAALCIATVSGFGGLGAAFAWLLTMDFYGNVTATALIVGASLGASGGAVVSASSFRAKGSRA